MAVSFDPADAGTNRNDASQPLRLRGVFVFRFFWKEGPRTADQPP
jgi:hypothetical protein